MKISTSLSIAVAAFSLEGTSAFGVAPVIKPIASAVRSSVAAALL